MRDLITPEQCSTCRYYRGDAYSGHCHRRAPNRRYSDHVGRWPSVPSNESCGEHRF